MRISRFMWSCCLITIFSFNIHYIVHLKIKCYTRILVKCFWDFFCIFNKKNKAKQHNWVMNCCVSQYDDNKICVCLFNFLTFYQRPSWSIFQGYYYVEKVLHFQSLLHVCIVLQQLYCLHNIARKYIFANCSVNWE